MAVTTAPVYRPSTRNHPLVESEFAITIDFHESLLGSQPTHNIAIDFVRSRQIEARAKELQKAGMSARAAKDQATEEVAASQATQEDDDEERPVKPTAFHADHKGLHLVDYQFRGFIKEIARALDLKVPGKGKGTNVSPAQDIALRTWVFGKDYTRRAYLERDGRVLHEPDEYLERSLRSNVMGQQRVSIAVSEVVHPPVQTVIKLQLLKGCRLTKEDIEAIFSFGAFQGMGQWRSGGFGRFSAHILEV